mgnify:CR=1 FL=1
MLDFQNQVAIITGAGKKNGIGYETAKKLSQLGATVICIDLSFEECSDEKIIFKTLDVTNPQDVQRLIEDVYHTYGRVDIFVNNAGVSKATKLEQISIHEYDEIFSVNMKGTFLCTQTVIPFMKKNRSGRIINVGSVSAKQGGGYFAGPHYAASKAAVSAFTKAVAKEVAAYNITANIVVPGLIDTGMTTHVLEDLKQRYQLLQNIPIKRFGKVDDVANAILFLASKESSYITAEEIDINGGSYIN